MGLTRSKPMTGQRPVIDVQRRNCDQLMAQLVADAPEVRRWAARDLADCHDSAMALLMQLRRESDTSVREVIFTTLIRMGDETTVKGLVQLLREDDAGLRNEAIDALKHMPKTVAKVMHELLEDPESDVRIFAVNILESLRHPDVEIWLIDVIGRDDHVNVCATAVDLLGEVGSPAALLALQHLKARFTEEPYIQFAADLAIKRILED
jgi:HEAT repeat protein